MRRVTPIYVSSPMLIAFLCCWLVVGLASSVVLVAFAVLTDTPQNRARLAGGAWPSHRSALWPITSPPAAVFFHATAWGYLAGAAGSVLSARWAGRSVLATAGLLLCLWATCLLGIRLAHRRLQRSQLEA